MNDPKLIIMSGLPGSGKSTIAERLSKKLALPVLSVDPIESSILKAGFERSFESGLAAYLAAETLAVEQLKNGLSVIIDAVNAENEAKQMWLDLAKKLKVRLVVIEATLDESIHRDRIENRNRNLHGIDEVTWDKVKARKKAYTDWPITVLRVNTTDIKEETIKELIQYIAKN